MRKLEFNREICFLIISYWKSRSGDLISGWHDLFGRYLCLRKLFLSRVIDFIDAVFLSPKREREISTQTFSKG